MELWDIDPSALATARAMLPGAVVRTVDVTNAASVDAAMVAARPDAVVHCAGILGPVLPATATSDSDFRHLLEVNLFGSFVVARASATVMLAAPRAERTGRIVLLGSIQGKEGMALGSAYSAAKAGVMALAKSMAKELATENITINVVSPVAAETAMARQISQARRTDILGRIPTGRFVELDEIAAMVAWLCSAEASFSTGAVFDLSGGRATY